MRHTPRPGVIPGGNLDALLQLSLRVVRDAAGPLHDALSEAGLLQAVGIVPRAGRSSPSARRCDSGAGSRSGRAARWMERIARVSQGGVRATGVLVGMGIAGRVCE